MIDEKNLSEWKTMLENNGGKPGCCIDRHAALLEFIPTMEALYRVAKAAERISISGRLFHMPEENYQVDPMPIKEAKEFREALASLREGKDL